ncbi:MAG: zinc ribbon domain-containing protein [Rhodoblastus sp.]|nr:MAG: zinc ribbon domain-containing protein [Rhodoblastus sp.]
MPIYSFACRGCACEFQTLVRSEAATECPRCASRDLEQRLSLIAAPKKGGEDAGAPACGPHGCGVGACPALAAGMSCG